MENDIPAPPRKRAKRGRFGAKSSTNSAQPRTPFTAATLKAWRNGRGLSRAGLGAALGISGDTIEHYEYGTRPIPPYFDKLIAYFDRYGPLDE